MGAEQFSTFALGRDPKEAFDRAREQAAYAYGHRGYTGTIAEKHDYVIVHQFPVTAIEAHAIAVTLFETDKRIQSKWGPAGAIPVALDTRTVVLKNMAGPLDELEDVEVMSHSCVNEVQLAEGEQITRSHVDSYVPPKRQQYNFLHTSFYVKDATVTLTIKKAPNFTKTIDGWLFFGYASS